MKEIPESLATLFGLVNCYSPTGQEAEAAGWMVARMKSLGYRRAYVDAAGNAVGVMGSGRHQIVLLGHIDTVRGEIPVRVEAGLLYGRGAVDAKGALAAFVDAVARMGPVDGWQVVVIGCIDEEGDSKGARQAVCGFQPDFAIIGEPSRWERITLGYKGSAWAQISVRQMQRHPASQGESACEAAVRAWNSIRSWAEDFNAGRERLFDQVQPTLREMASGGDGFEDWARLTVGARLPLDFPPEEWYASLNGLISEAKVEAAGYPIPAYRAGKNTRLVRAFLAAIRARGGRPGFVSKSGTADLNIVAPAWACPVVAYGPGDASLDHTPHEHLSLEEFARSVEVLKAVLKDLTVLQ